MIASTNQRMFSRSLRAARSGARSFSFGCRGWGAGSLLFLAMTSGCGAKADGTSGGNTSWLACETDSDCAGTGDDYACQEGACMPAGDVAADDVAQDDAPLDDAPVGDDDAPAQPRTPDAGDPTGLDGAPTQESPDADVDAGAPPAPIDVVAPMPEAPEATPDAGPASLPNDGPADSPVAPEPSPVVVADPPPQDGLGWTPPTSAETFTINVSNPKVATDAAGNAVSVWRQWRDSPQTYGIGANSYTAGVGWGETATVFSSTNGAYTNEPCVAGNPNGAAVAAWSTTSSASVDAVYEVWAAQYSVEGGWTEATQVGPTEGPAVTTHCAMDLAGNAMVAWAQSNDTDNRLLVARAAAGESWGPYESIGGASVGIGMLGLALDSAGDAIVVWNTFEEYVATMWSNRFSPANGWGEPVQIPTTPGRSLTNLDVALGEHDDAIAVWSEHSMDGIDHQIWATSLTDAGEWGPAVELDDGSEIASLPLVGIDANGSAIAAWEGFTQLTESTYANALRYSRYTVAGGWEGPNLLAADATQFSLSMSTTGIAVAAWRAPYDYTVDGDIAAAWFSADTGFSEATLFADDDPGNSSTANVSTNDSGVTTVVWLNQDADGSDIWADRRE